MPILLTWLNLEILLTQPDFFLLLKTKRILFTLRAFTLGLLLLSQNKVLTAYSRSIVSKTRSGEEIALGKHLKSCPRW